MRFRDLPGFHPLFVDLAESLSSATGLFPRPPNDFTLLADARRVPEPSLSRQVLCDVLAEQAAEFNSGPLARENIDRLRTTGSKVVVASIRPRILGGPLCDWLKALTAAKLATWLSERVSPAIPVVWMDLRMARADLRVGLLSPDGPRRMEIDTPPHSSCRLPDSIRPWLRAVTTSAGMEGSEVKEWLEAAYAPGKSLADAWGSAFSRMLDAWGIVVLNPDHPDFRDVGSGIDAATEVSLMRQQADRLVAAGYLRSGDVAASVASLAAAGGSQPYGSAPLAAQCRLLPVTAFVVDESEVIDAALQLWACAELRRCAPVMWQRLSATVVDVRSRKFLDRYGLDIRALYDGPQRVADRLDHGSQEPETLSRLEALNAAVQGGLADLSGLAPKGDRLVRGIDDARRRMTYQIGKLAAAYSAARERRRRNISNHANYLCNHLAPWGDLQERGVAGFQFVQRFSPSAPRLLDGSLDFWKIEHQVVFL